MNHTGTGEFQPADTLLQRIVKHLIKTAALDFFVAWSTRLLKNGSKPEDISLPIDLPTLRNASIAWTLEAYYYLQGRPEIVRKAWEKCRAHGWDLSWGKLTSPEATELFFTTIANNAAFRNEVATREPVIPRAIAGASGEETEEATGVGEADDDLSLSADQLVAALTGTIDPTIVANEEGAFQRHGDEDDIQNVHPLVHHSNYPTEIAVLGGTHPAALEDLSAKVLKTTLGTKRGNPKKKSVAQKSGSSTTGIDTNRQLEGEPSGAAAGASATVGLPKSCSKRPRRDTTASCGQVTGGEVAAVVGKQKGKRSRK